jgi:hypothetical protein
VSPPPGQFLQPDHDKGDANTIGGYIAVHDRPAAFEGSDGFSYSVEILAEPSGDARGSTWGAFLLFVQWARLGAQAPEGHLETEYLGTGPTEERARGAVEALPLSDVKRHLDRLIAARDTEAPRRRWFDAMRDESDGGEHT